MRFNRNVNLNKVIFKTDYSPIWVSFAEAMGWRDKVQQARHVSLNKVIFKVDY
jgi:hypothetical protein